MRNKFAKVSDPSSFVTDPGDRKHVILSPSVNMDGSIDLIESGEEDIQEYIDSFREQTDMSWILNRLMAGDDSVLNQRDPLYGDFTAMPKTYAEALQLVIDRQSQFNALPLEVRNLFDNDFNKWFSTAGSEDWVAKMDTVIHPHSSDIMVTNKEVDSSDES